MSKTDIKSIRPLKNVKTLRDIVRYINMPKEKLVDLFIHYNY